MSLARLGEVAAAPDSIGLDAEAAVWYADVPSHRCVRVREGEVLETVNTGLGCVSCALAAGRATAVQGGDRLVERPGNGRGRADRPGPGLGRLRPVS
jgi:hypothetical protein